MRKIRYLVAMSVDGYIAGPNGESDWIAHDPELDFPAMWAQFDTLLMGRRTYQAATSRLGESAFAGLIRMVFSRTLKPQDHPGITVVRELTPQWVRSLKGKSGKDIWLVGGSKLFRSFLDCDCVDTVELNVIPVLLGDGVPLLSPPYDAIKLQLLNSKVYRSGRISLAYKVVHSKPTGSAALQ